MNNFKFLLLGTSLSFLPTLSYAQCVATQDCATLGYTETSCNGGKGVKCPFGNKWACLGANEEKVRNKLCQELGFTQTCTGTGYAGGAGSACGGKYNYCNCTNGYEWKNRSCQKKEVLDGPDGDVYKCNGKVVGVKTSEMNFYIAMKDLGEMNWSDANSSCQNYSFCGNLKGTLPTLNQLQTMYKNKFSLNSLLSTNSGTKLTEDWYWSSTFYSSNYFGNSGFYPFSISVGSSANRYYGNTFEYKFYVRPVLTSW